MSSDKQASLDFSQMDTEPLNTESVDLGLDLHQLENGEEYYISSEGEYEWNTDDEEVEPYLSVNNNADGISNKQETLTASQDALVPVEGQDEEEDDISSDEERDLLKGIKDEIDQRVREEMKSELDMYKEKLKAIENGRIDDTENKTNDDLEGLDPKIKEGLIKMRKLDKILNKKLKREKEVKKDRILLERRMRDEIAELNNGKREHREVKTNTEKYLSLELPASHNEGVHVDVPPSVTPVFQTQVEESDILHDGKEKCKIPAGKTNSKLNTDHTESTDSIIGGKTKKKKKKDFIKRNKELASQSEEMIAMTDEDRNRVSGLLVDLDSLLDQPDNMIFTEDENPYQIAVPPGEGYLPNSIEQRSLFSIDSQLKHILPIDEYDSLISTPQTLPHKFFTRVDVKSSVLDFEKYGEKVLKETKLERDMKEKLQRIEEELALFNNPREMKLESPSLSENQLNQLLDQCARSISRTSCVTEMESEVDATPRSIQSTSRSSIYDNPVVLPHDVLQKLLAEAYCPISSKLTSVAEDANESDDEMEPISAETWKIVAEEEIDEDDMKHLLTSKHFPSESHIKPSVNNPNIYSTNSENYKPEYRDKQPFLPEISKSPFLISQGLNNEITNRPTSRECAGSSGDQYPIDIIRNSLTDSSIVLESFSDCEAGDATLTPRPPSRDKRPSSNQSNRSNRTITPISGYH